MALKAQETTYYVENLDQAVDFYTRALGFELKLRLDWGFALIAIGGKPAVGLMARHVWRNQFGAEDALAQPRLVLQADDLDAELARLKAAGVRVSQVAGKVGSARSATFWDLEGNPFFVWHDPQQPF